MTLRDLLLVTDTGERRAILPPMQFAVSRAYSSPMEDPYTMAVMHRYVMRGELQIHFSSEPNPSSVERATKVAYRTILSRLHGASLNRLMELEFAVQERNFENAIIIINALRAEMTGENV